MQALKCTSVDDLVFYLTEGKFYRIVRRYSDNTCDILDDNGERTYVHIPNSCHGTFEIVEADE
ncbi:MAG: hypothetical protein Tp1111DCM1126091_8 [Prokaryotic dsDNA virus sp.]|nr:MAG: hypothetical protein Tp1111DCM1126091_8 [Prokaryotic dsDNA virus sp.]|tara:strand:- start:10728 stop:10916 length:189 start_codon:yes stop_codon:yes gene_type:complete